MRPPGEIRCALRNAASALAVEGASRVTWRDLAQRASVGFSVARQTIRNMQRAGELRAVGEVRVQHSRRPMTAYAPPANEASGPASLDALMRTWAR